MFNAALIRKIGLITAAGCCSQFHCIGVQEVFLQDDVCRSQLVDQDWTEVVPAAPPQSRTHTFVLGDSEMSSSLLMTMSTPATIRAASAGAAALKSRPAARSKIPAATARRSHGAALETSCSNGALAAAAASEEAAAAVRLVEDSISPLARANSQISESIAQLEKSLLTLKAATFAETPNSD